LTSLSFALERLYVQRASLGLTTRRELDRIGPTQLPLG
jgi:hypothetical protein